MGNDLFLDYGAITAAGDVADRQCRHLGDVDRYVTEVCHRTEAFRGLIAPLGGPYADALASVTSGLMRGGEAATRWGDAARDTAADLAETDVAARRLLDRVRDSLPDRLPDLHTVPAVAPALAGAAPIPPGCAVPPLPERSPVPLGTITGLTPDLPHGLGSAWGLGGTLIGQGLTFAKNGKEVTGTSAGAGDDLRAAATTGDDLDRYADFAGGGS